MNLKRIISYISIFICGIALDQLVKRLAVMYLEPIRTHEIIKGIFRLEYCENTGAAFSLFEGQRIVFIILTSLVILAIAFLLMTNRVQGALARYSLLLIATGGVGNLIDRVLHGYVVDMFNFYYVTFAVFNVADIFVTCATILFILSFLIKKGDVVIWKK